MFACLVSFDAFSCLAFLATGAFEPVSNPSPFKTTLASSEEPATVDSLDSSLVSLVPSSVSEDDAEGSKSTAGGP